MIYPTSKKISNFQFPISNANQAGVTLLLAILILASILAISFSLATVLFIEVRTSGDLIKTEPAIYAATGVGEQALFDLQRGACPSNGAACYTTNFPNGVTMPAAPTTVASSSPIFTDRVKTGSTLSGTNNKYFFCSGSGTGGCGYGKAIVNYIPSNTGSDPLYAFMCEFDDTGHTSYPSAPCTATGTTQGYWKVPDNGFPQNADGSVTLTPSNPSVSWTITNSGLQQELILANPAGSKDIFAQIQTFAPNGTTGQGLPYLGKTAINVSILNSVVGRRIQVTAPNPVTSTGATSSIATHFFVSGPSPVIAGTAFNNLLVQALDVNNNIVTGYSGTVHFTSTDGAATLPANSTLTNGTKTFTATLNTAGTKTITAADTVNSLVTGNSNSIIVNSIATHFLVSTPGSATVGSAFSFTVTALNASNNVVTGYSGTVHFTSTDGAAVLPANSSLTSGTGTFSATLNTLGGKTITAVDTGNSSINGTSPTVTVSNLPLNLDFELGSVGSCPTYWSCTDDAMIASASDGQGCANASNVHGSQYLKAGCDYTTGTAQSRNFVLPTGIYYFQALRAGGADGWGGSGWFVKRASDNATLCSAQNGNDTDTFFTDDCWLYGNYAGTSVYIYVVDNQTGDWSKTYLDNIQLMDSSGNVLSP